jgi:hypothetical protein
MRGYRSQLGEETEDQNRNPFPPGLIDYVDHTTALISSSKIQASRTPARNENRSPAASQQRATLHSTIRQAANTRNGEEHQRRSCLAATVRPSCPLISPYRPEIKIAMCCSVSCQDVVSKAVSGGRAMAASIQVDCRPERGLNLLPGTKDSKRRFRVYAACR